MAKLVIGKNKIKTVPAILKDSSPAHYVEKTVDTNGKLQNSTNIINLNGVTDVGDYVLTGNYYGTSFPANASVDLSSLTTISGNNACSYMFYGCTGITSVDLSSLTTISGHNGCNNMFYQCPDLTSVDLSSLTTISGSSGCQYMLQKCSSLTNVNLSSLTTINGDSSCQYMFGSCTGLTSIDLPSLTTISGNAPCNNMFISCGGLTTAKLNALNTMPVPIAPSYAQIFGACLKLESVELGGLTSSTFASRKDQIAYLFNKTTGSQAPNGCTLHFPSNFNPESADKTFDITTLTGYPTFGGNASYIHLAYDLPATE